MNNFIYTRSLFPVIKCNAFFANSVMHCSIKRLPTAQRCLIISWCTVALQVSPAHLRSKLRASPVAQDIFNTHSSEPEQLLPLLTFKKVGYIS